jgi:hypothetical protein
MQAVYDTLSDGSFNDFGDHRLTELVAKSLKVFGSDLTCRSMLLDAATVMYGGDIEAVVSAWEGMYKHAATRVQQLIESSLIKVVDGMIRMNGIIRAIAIKMADDGNDQCMTRVWRDDQVRLRFALFIIFTETATTNAVSVMYMFFP